MANFKNIGNYYVSKSGSDANVGTDPNNPCLTIQKALDSAQSGDIVLVGSGVYTDDFEAIVGEAPTVKGDGITIIDRKNQPLTDSTFRSEDLIYIGVTSPILKGNAGEATRCIFINCPDLYLNFGASRGTLTDCRLINSTWSGASCNATNVVLINSTIEATQGAGADTGFNGCVIDPNSRIICADTLEFLIRYSNIEGTLNVAGTNYDLSGAQSAHPSIFGQGNFNQESKFNRLSGEVITNDFTVQGDSPLLGVGENGTNIGAVRRGIPQTRNSNAIQNGTISQIVFSGNTWQVQGGNTTGVVTSDVIDFGLTVKSPRLTLKGIVNFLDNVPDFDNALLNPNKLSIEARYAIIGQDISVQTWKQFLLNEQIFLDTSGKSNAESGFDWADTVTQPMKDIQLRITLRQNYNPA